MFYQQLISGYRAGGFKLKTYGQVEENGRKYSLYKIVLNNGGRNTLLITTGFHGEEFNGPISLLKIIKDAAAYARAKKVNLTAYLCVNPSGFDLKKRYNASGEDQNNDFLRYQVAGGKRISTLKKNEKFSRFKLVNSPAKEVKLLQADLRANGLLKKIPAAVLDIHQDDDLSAGDFYAYIFEGQAVYEMMMKAAEKVGKRARSVAAMNYEDGRKVKYRINKDGFIFLHDGTFTDMFYRLGVQHPITVETNTRASLSKVSRINEIWIKSLIDLIKT